MRAALRRLASVAAAAWASVMLAGAAGAAELRVKVRGADGAPVADAVVMLRTARSAAEPIRFPWPLVMEQRGMRFHPFVLVAPTGSEVAFPNHDSVRHHVYSFSPAKTFELKLYGRDETRRVRFEKTGVVAVGCNIHDDMEAYIRVVDTPYAGKTAANGEVVLHDAPAGAATLAVWHPYVRGGRDVVREVVLTGADVGLAVRLDLKPAPLRHGGY